MSAVIVMKDLTKSYGNTLAVDELTLDIEAGEVFGLLGHNGAGKTTTASLLTTLLQPTEGSATVAGYDIENDLLMCGVVLATSQRTYASTTN